MAPLAELPPELAAIMARAAAELPAGLALQQQVHVLDLAPGGEILPHVDSVKHLGEHILGVSCLSDGVMSFRPVGELQEGVSGELYPERGAPGGSELRVWLPRRSLYVMSGACRHQWAHGVLQGAAELAVARSPEAWAGDMAAAGAQRAESPYGQDAGPPWRITVRRGRRMSLLLRDEPPA